MGESVTDKNPSDNSIKLADMFFKRLIGMNDAQARNFLATTFDIMVNKAIDETIERMKPRAEKRKVCVGGVNPDACPDAPDCGCNS